VETPRPGQAQATTSDSEVLGSIRALFPSLNDGQINAIATVDGPLQVIAGPGSGKTLVLVLRTLFLLLTGRAQPNQILVTTFTEKAAFELRDRLNEYGRLLGYKGPLYELHVGTIHSFCDEFLRRYVGHSPLKKNYDTLDELTQSLFLNERFTQIVPDEMKVGNLYFGRWEYKWTVIRGLIPYLNKAVEELIDVKQLEDSREDFLKLFCKALRNYERESYKANKIDFAHQQKLFLDLLKDPELRDRIKRNLRYILVDEYQDTNYIQERILFTLAQPENNICIVGDEDQSLYRFRGATVRNILEFQSHFKNSRQIVLDINYRSHSKIIEAYNDFMNGIDWKSEDGKLNYRFEKRIREDPEGEFPDYPAVFSIWGTSQKDEAMRFASLVKYLKEKGIIQDFSQVALLLHSVRLEHSGHYLAALEELGIPYFAPRARAYFENEEVREMVGCYAVIFGFYEEMKELTAFSFENMVNYINDGISRLGPYSQSSPLLAKYIQDRNRDIQGLKPGESLDMTMSDYFYELLAFEPFASYMKNENRARNLATFSQLLTEFQNYYHVKLVTARNKDWINKKLFVSFIKLLLDNGIDDYEDPYNPIPQGYVQVMTVHQSKGLEFPVVVVGSLSVSKRTAKQIDRDLAPFYHRVPFEPEDRITLFDTMRQYYVAFSRAAKLLALTASEQPKEYFDPIWQGLPQWPYVEKAILETLRFKARKQFIPKKSYSLTSHINVFEVCPRQYQLYQEYAFSASRSATMTFGTLVHQTIEDIHRRAVEGRFNEITPTAIAGQWFESNYQSLLLAGMRPLSFTRKQAALNHVLRYYHNNMSELHRVVETEVDVSVEKPDYILTGKIDLIMGKDGKLEVLDFKTQRRPKPGDPLADRYYKQLCLYSHILRERHGKSPERLYIYWTAEKSRRTALMEFPVDDRNIKQAGEHFDQIVRSIRSEDFTVRSPPASTVCKECDFRTYCDGQGTIKFRFRHTKRRGASAS
jgi:DNA helicase-2/ATP-dependent DNA helicase PcrA